MDLFDKDKPRDGNDRNGRHRQSTIIKYYGGKNLMSPNMKNFSHIKSFNVIISQRLDLRRAWGLLRANNRFFILFSYRI
jgi:hypothetical protein